MSHQNSTTGTISLTVLPQENGSYLCRLVPTLNGESNTAQAFYGQTPEHAMAIALESLAAEYRKKAEENQESQGAEDGRKKRSRSPYAGTVGRVKVLGQSDQVIQVEVVLKVSDHF